MSDFFLSAYFILFLDFFSLLFTVVVSVGEFFEGVGRRQKEKYNPLMSEDMRLSVCGGFVIGIICSFVTSLLKCAYHFSSCGTSEYINCCIYKCFKLYLWTAGGWKQNSFLLLSWRVLNLVEKLWIILYNKCSASRLLNRITFLFWHLNELTWLFCADGAHISVG